LTRIRILAHENHKLYFSLLFSIGAIMNTITPTRNSSNDGNDHDGTTPLPWNCPTDIDTTNANTFTAPFYQHPTANIMMLRKRRLFAFPSYYRASQMDIYPSSNPASFVVAAVVSIRMRATLVSNAGRRIRTSNSAHGGGKSVCRRRHTPKAIGDNSIGTWRCRGITFPLREFLHHEM
jgi:hypothetical protein